MNFKQDKEGKSYFNNSSHTNLKLQVCYLDLLAASSTASSKGKSVIKPSARKSSCHGKQNFNSCGIEGSTCDTLCRRIVNRCCRSYRKLKQRKLID